MTTKWPLVPLGEIAEVIAGQSPEGRHYNSDGVGMPFYQGKKDFSDRWIAPAGTWTRESTKVAEKGDILMSVRAPVGPVNLATGKCCVGRGLAAIRPSGRVSTDFLFYYLQSIQEQISGNEGAVFASINKSQIAALRIPLPPLDEQKRIVAKLDEAQQQFDRLNNNLEQQLSQLTDFDSALLSEMLGDPRHTPDPAVTTKGPMVRLGDFVGINPQKSEARKLLNPDDPISFLPMEDLGVRCGEVTPIKQRRFGDVQSSHTYFRDGDVLLAKITPCFENGKLGIARNLVNGVGFGSSEYLVIRPAELLLSEYVYYVISRSEFVDRGQRVMTGSVGHKRVPKDYVSELRIPLPPLDEQKRIVAKLDEASLATSSLRSNILDRKKRASELQSSILAAAFAGAL